MTSECSGLKPPVDAVKIRTCNLVTEIAPRRLLASDPKIAWSHHDGTKGARQFEISQLQGRVGLPILTPAGS